LRIIDWPKLFVPESSVEPIPMPKSLPRDSPFLLERVVTDQVERDVQTTSVVAGVVDAAIGCLVRELFVLDVVLLARLDRVEAELAGHDVDDPFGQPEVLHA
jgi:hypothetical protein